MPTYEYACAACGHEWEQTQRITEPPVEGCPVCGKSTAHRLISAGTNFILKGGGWYSDLYASPKPSSDAGKPSTEVTEKNGEKKAEKTGEKATTPAETVTKSATKPASTEGGSTVGTPSGTSSAPTG